MTDNDFEEFCNLVSSVGDLYGKEQSRFALGLWWGALKNFDLVAIRDALSKHVKNPDAGQFMPKPADVVKMIGGSTVDSALIAWSKVDRAVRSVGTYKDVVFDDPVIHRVIEDMGGWIQLGTRTEDEWPFVAKEFENRYRGYAARGVASEYQSVLIGISNAHNVKNGFVPDEPVLIGNVQKASHVRELGGNRPLEITRIGEKLNMQMLGASA